MKKKKKGFYDFNEFLLSPKWTSKKKLFISDLDQQDERH